MEEGDEAPASEPLAIFETGFADVLPGMESVPLPALTDPIECFCFGFNLAKLLSDPVENVVAFPVPFGTFTKFLQGVATFTFGITSRLGCAIV